MLKPLTNEQQIKVEENMGLVGKVIQDCVHTLGTGDFEATWRDVLEGCTALLEELRS